jgi:hypothetical protein
MARVLEVGVDRGVHRNAVIACTRFPIPIREDRPMAETLHLAPPYEPPRIERVLIPEDLAREIQYAGDTGTPTTDDGTPH